MLRARIFETTYQNYLEDLSKIDILGKAEALGGKKCNNGIGIRFFNRFYAISQKGIVCEDGADPPFPVKIVLCKYVLMCPECLEADSTHFLTYREFQDAGPLVTYFANNTNKTIESTFAGKMDWLTERCLAAGAEKLSSDIYDLSVQFFALPKIPIVLNFNDKDELFPAACSILFQSTAESYLDMECLAITGTYLTGLLI